MLRFAVDYCTDIAADREDVAHTGADVKGDGETLTCAALATGMKCLPQQKLAQAKGNVLHDWHAEVLAIRAFNRFLVDECRDLAAKGFGNANGGWLKWTKQEEKKEHSQPFELEEGVNIHMYCSEAPCGDVSMELTMAEQQDAAPWPSPDPAEDVVMMGRGHFDQLGVVRRKPARPDAPMTLSKSCSDKLALKQCTSLLSGLSSLLVAPAGVYLRTLVFPERQVVDEAVERCFGVNGRMKDLDERREWETDGYSFRPFEIARTSREFAYSKYADASPSNLSALLTPEREEVLINGVLLGRKQFDPKGASCVSRRAMWEDVVRVATAVESKHVVESLKAAGTYGNLKGGRWLAGRDRAKREVKEVALKGWKKNTGDEDWGLESGG